MACFAENLCLYGMPDGQWAVDLPAEEVPPEMPEPSLGYAISSLFLLNVVALELYQGSAFMRLQLSAG